MRCCGCVFGFVRSQKWVLDLATWQHVRCSAERELPDPEQAGQPGHWLGTIRGCARPRDSRQLFRHSRALELPCCSYSMIMTGVDVPEPWPIIPTQAFVFAWIPGQSFLTAEFHLKRFASVVLLLLGSLARLAVRCAVLHGVRRRMGSRLAGEGEKRGNAPAECECLDSWAGCARGFWIFTGYRIRS